jgi:hypothetical protein
MNKLRHGLSGYSMPAYVEEILTGNYCNVFVRMTIIKDGDSYRFTYRPGNLKRLDINSLDTYEKLLLLRSIITLSQRASSYLIRPESYLIEPELVYSSGNRVNSSSLRLIFYPDVTALRFENKLINFAERIRNSDIREERELMDQFRDLLEEGDLARASWFLDKNILRIENRTFRKAG